MKIRTLAVTVLVLVVAVLATSAAAAQPGAPVSPQPELQALGRSASPAHPALGIDAPERPALPAPVGTPGLSFRYLATRGLPREPYIDDAAHLTWPFGVWAGGDQLWVADPDGVRAVRYSNSGSFVGQVGKTGWRGGIPGDVNEVIDVALDPSGNLWVVAGNSQVVKLSPAGQLLLTLGEAWNGGSDNGHFSDVVSVALDAAGNVYVSDGSEWGYGGNQRIQVFNSAGQYLATIGVSGVAGSNNQHFDGPRHITVYDNLLYVPDTLNHRVQIFNIANPAAAEWVGTLGQTGQPGGDNSHFDHPAGVAVNTDRIFVADQWNQRVQVFDRTTRAHLATLGGSWGPGNNQMNNPHDVAVDAAGNLYIADRDNNRVQQFNAALTYIRTFGTTGVPYVTDSAHFHAPQAIAPAANGDVLVAEQKGHRLLRLSAEGVPLWTIGTAGICNDLCGPSGLATDQAGRIYVSNSWDPRITVHNPDGSLSATLGSGGGTGNYQFADASGVAVDGAGRIFVADRGNQRVQVYDANRVYMATLGVTGQSGTDNAHFGDPTSVAVDGQGRLYVADRSNHRVQVFNANLSYLRTVGVTGSCGGDYAQLCNPVAVAADAEGRLYVGDSWGSRILVFDSSGLYVATVAESGGGGANQVRQA